MVIDYGPDGVWQEHRRRLLAAAALSNSSTLSDDLEDWEQQQQQQQREPRRASHEAQGRQLQGQSGPSSAGPSFPAAPTGPSAQRRHLFPKRPGGSPGLHKAVIPKLYAIDSWRPRLYSQLLPKYLLSFDGACTAHLYRNLGRLQPTRPGHSQVSKSTPWIPSQLSSASPDAGISTLIAGAAPAAAAGAVAAGAVVRQAGSQTSAVMSPGVAARQAPRPFTQEALTGLASQEQAAYALMVKAVGAAIAPKLPDFGADALTAIPLGLAECGVLDTKLLMVWEKVVTAKVVAWPSGHLADLALGLGALGLVPEPALRVAYYGAVLKRLPRFRPQQLADLLRGFTALAQPNPACMQADTQRLQQSHEQAPCIDKQGLQHIQGEPSSLHPGSSDGPTNLAVKGGHIPESDATTAAACLAGKKLCSKLLSTARRMLTSSPPVSGTHCTAVITWAAATGMTIPPSWMVWYSQYIRDTLVQRPGLLGFRDQVAILEALAQIHEQRHTRDRSTDLAGSLKPENGSVGNISGGSPPDTQASESLMLHGTDTAVEELVQALVSALTGSASEQRVPAPLLARVCRALRQLGHAPPGSLITAAVVSTMRHMSVLTAAQVANVAGALRAWGVKPPAAWSAAALVHTQQRHVLQACTSADLAVLAEMLPMLSGVRLPVQWFEAFLGELVSRCDGGVLGQRMMDSGEKDEQGEEEKGQDFQQDKGRHGGWDNRNHQEGDSIGARSRKVDVQEVQEERLAEMGGFDGSGPQPQQQDMGHPSWAGVQQPLPQEAGEELASQAGRQWSWVKPDADRREITGDQLGMLLITLMNVPGANEAMSLLARQQPALMEAVMQLCKAQQQLWQQEQASFSDLGCSRLDGSATGNPDWNVVMGALKDLLI